MDASLVASYYGVTMDLQWIYSGITMELQWNYYES